MSKQSGLGDRLYVGGFDLSGDVGSLGAIGGGPNTTEVTSINKSAKERLGLLRDARIEFSSWLDTATGAEHDVLAALPRTDVGLLYSRGNAVGVPAAAMVAKQVNYDGSRGDDGSFEWSVNALGSGYGLEWGLLGTDGIVSDVSNGTGASASVDGGASTLFGGQLYVQMTEFTGDSFLVAVETSSDDGVGDAWASVAGMSVLPQAVGSYRAESTSATATLERYLRISWGTFSTYTSASFVAMFVRNETARSF